MKLFWVILKGFLTIWVLLALTMFGLMLLATDLYSAAMVTGITSTVIAGIIVFFVVQSRVKLVEKMHPELRKKKPRK